MSIIFQCRKCGSCCRNLFDDIKGISKGIVLTAKEVNLFPSKMISPNLAIGKKSPKTIITYQLNVDICPHIDETTCLIYNKRPLTCRAFPFVSGNFSIRCPVFSYRKKGLLYSDYIPSKSQVNASEKLNKYVFTRILKYKRGKIWDYDLATKKWILTASVEDGKIKIN